MGIDMIRKRDGREVPFDQDKIEQAIFASFQASGSARGHETSRKLTEEVVRLLENNENISAIPSVEQVQDTVEQVLMRNGFTRTAKSYILYRAERSRVREMNSPPDAHVWGHCVQRCQRIRHQARERQHQWRYCHGRNAQVRQRRRKAVLREVRHGSAIWSGAHGRRYPHS